MTWGTVFVEGLRLEASIGVLDHERRRRQPLVVDIRMEIDRAAPVEGRLDTTTDYRIAADHARRLAAAGHVELLETYAERLASACLENPGVAAVTVRARKPDAIPGAEAAGVEIIRRRQA